MIKFENTEVFNFEGAFRGMRNPLNSWDKSDSITTEDKFIIGKNDLKLAQSLIKAGSDHRKFMRQIIVSVDIIASIFWWKEFDTYKVGTVANSCSTMHTLTKDSISFRNLGYTDNDFEDENSGLKLYADDANMYRLGEAVQDVCEICDEIRRKYNETGDKRYWKVLIQLLPSGFNQRRTVTLNYEVLRNIYGSRRNHKLDEWSVGFIDWIKTLPYAEELITI